MTRSWILTFLIWHAISATALAQGDGSGVKTWLMGYLIVVLFLGLGVFAISKPSSRKREDEP